MSSVRSFGSFIIEILSFAPLLPWGWSDKLEWGQLKCATRQKGLVQEPTSNGSPVLLPDSEASGFLAGLGLPLVSDLLPELLPESELLSESESDILLLRERVRTGTDVQNKNF